MAKRWTPKDDGFLLRFHGIPGGANHIASHDLGRPDGAGKRRMKILTDSGARYHHAQMKISELNWFAALGHADDDWEGEYQYWEREVSICENKRGGL